MARTAFPHEDGLSQAEAIQILNDWGSRGLFRGKNFGTSIHLQSIEPTPCYELCGCTQYERRSVRRAISPYYGGKIDDRGTPPSMWDMKVERPRHEFVNTSRNIPVPHTERLLTCEECRGNRRIECALCEGSGEEPCRQCYGGRISCGACGGSGSVQGQVTDYVYNYQTNNTEPVTRYETHSCNSCGGYGSFSCHNCNGSGLVVCVSCNGDGDLRCETCDEQGKVREYKLLNVVFEYQSNSETIGALEIPDEKLQQVAGVEIFQTEEDTITSLHGINDPRLTNHALEFLAQFNPSSSIMLYQELTITRIPVFKVAYKKHFAGKQKVLWIYGNEHQVYFEGQSSFSRKASKREVATGSFKSLALLTLLFLLTASQIYGYVRYGFFPSSPVFVITSLPSSIFLKTTLTKTTDADVTGVAISSDGQTLVSGDLAGFITVWNLETGELKRTINTTQAVWSIALTPDDQTVVSGNDDGTIGLWNLETSELKRTLTGHSNSVAYLAITPDGQTLASAGNMGDKSDKTVKVWNLETGELKRTLRGHEYWLLSIAISPDGQTVASSSSDNTIRLWSLDTGEQKNIFYMKNTGVLGNRDVANAIVFSPDGKNLLANMSTYGNIELWNLNTGKQKNIFLDTNNKTQHNTSNIVISPDGQTLVGGSGYGTLMVWNLNKGELKNTLKGHIHSISNLTLSPDGRTLVSGGYDGTIKIWRVP